MWQKMKQELSFDKPSTIILPRFMWAELLKTIVIALCLVISGCSLPAYNIFKNAGQDYRVVSGHAFQHLLSFNKSTGDTGAIVVFVEGDGTPWKSRYQVSYEPTSDSPLLLNWFVESSLPSVYLGRPCYFDLDDKRCSAYWYTHGRYSNDVVTSMVEALNKPLADRQLILVGHSGGGTLVMLMAERMPNVKAVITIAGNLQVKQWTEFHRYSELAGSLDPSFSRKLNDDIKQIHFYSLNDEVIKAEWVRQFALKQKNAELIELPVKGHHDGWNVYRSDIMKVLRRTKFEIDHSEQKKDKVEL